MKKLDVLMIKSFLAPFVLTTAVANFILVLVYMLRYFDDFVGKNLGIAIIGELLFYFSMRTLQTALPLGVLLASLMTFGNLGENFELTAIKSSGISLLRTLRPLFIFVVTLSICAFFFNNYTVPVINLKAYSLLYDVKNAKPALDIKEGSFYNGIPGYSIKAKEKLPDNKTLLDVIIYEHADGKGNQTVILADSSLMYTILNERYLKLELYNGNYYSEEPVRNNKVNRLHRTEYDHMDMVFSLASFDLKRRKEELFQNNRQMKTITELIHDVDSFGTMYEAQKRGFIKHTRSYLNYHLSDKEDIINRIQIDTANARLDSASLVNVSASLLPGIDGWFQTRRPPPIPQRDSAYLKRKFSLREAWVDEQSDRKPALDSIEGKISRKSLKRDVLYADVVDTLSWDHLDEAVTQLKRNNVQVIGSALNSARNIKVNLEATNTRMYEYRKNTNLYAISMYQKYAQAFACIIMFLIGAPLGAIIKKGGLGVPTIVAILFFIVYYVFTSVGEKQAKEGMMDPILASWMADMVLLPFGLFFLKQARVDARLLEVDAYRIGLEKLKRLFAEKRNKT